MTELPDDMEARTPAPEGGAVAWRTRYKPGGSAALWTVSTADPRPSWPPAVVVNYEVQPLYASPVVPVGVSREDIAKTLFDRHWSAVSASPKWPGEDDDDGSYWLWLADAIIAALRPTDTGWEA
jgi:hypothetical protein